MFKSLVAGIIGVIAALFGIHSASITPTALSYNRANPPAQLAASAVVAQTPNITTSDTNNTTQQLSNLSSNRLPSSGIPGATVAKVPVGYAVSETLAQQISDPFVDYATLAELASTTAALQSEIAAINNPVATAQVPQQVAAGGSGYPYSEAQAIDSLSNVAISNPSIENLSASDIPDLSGKYLSLDGGAVTGTTTFAGNVGIGQTSPTYNLDVSGVGHFTGLVDAANFVATSTTATTTLSGNVVIGTGSNNIILVGTTTPFSDPNTDVGFLDDWSNGHTAWYWTYKNGVGSVSTAAGQDPAFYLNNFSDFTGLYLQKAGSGAGDYIVAETSTGAPIFDVKSSGNVGIGTTSPATTLSVSGNGYLTGGLGIGMLNTTAGTIQSTGAVTGSAFNATAISTGYQLNGTPVLSYAGGPVQVGDLGGGISLGSATHFYVDPTGNVGIGTTSPATTLSTQGNEYTTGGLGVGVLNTTGGTLQTSGNAIIGRNVGLTKSSEIYWNDVSDGIITEDNPSWFSGSTNVMTFNTYNGPWVFQNTSNDTIPFVINGISGNVGIGTTSPQTQLGLQGGIGVNSSQLYLAGNGEVGVNTNTPTASLTVGGAINFTGASADFNGPSIADSSDGLLLTAGTTNGVRINNSTNNAELLRVTNAGNVGIGTTSPATTLSVSGNGYLTGGLTVGGAINFTGASADFNGPSIADSSDGLLLTAGTTNGVRINNSTNNAELLRVTNAGNVGIGTTTPTSKLTVVDSANGANAWIESSANNAGLVLNDTASGGKQWEIDSSAGVAGPIPSGFEIARDGGGGTYFGIDSSGDVGFGGAISNSSFSGAALVALATGNVGIGTTTPGTSPNNIQENFTVYGNGLAVNDGGGTNSMLMGFYGSATGYFGTNSNNNLIFRTNNTNAATINTSQELGIATLAAGTSNTLCYNTGTIAGFNTIGTCSSDERVKTNINPLDASSSLAAIEELNPVSFNWNPQFSPDQSEQYGFLAEQIQQVFPSLVSTSSPTSLTPGGTLSLNYNGLFGPIVAAIQALDQELTSLENTVAGFAESFTSNQITATNEICISSTCIDQQQLAAILASQGGDGSSGQGSASTDAALSTAAATDTPPVIQINGDNPAIVQVGATYNDLGATITGPQADLNLGITTYLNGQLESPIELDTTEPATDTIDYVVTDGEGNTSTSTRTVDVIAPQSSAASSTPHTTTATSTP